MSGFFKFFENECVFNRFFEKNKKASIAARFFIDI